MSISLPIAGWLERHAGKQEVAGSIPGGGIHLLPIAQAMGIRIVLASSGVCAELFPSAMPCLLTRRLVVMHARTEVVSLYYEDDSS